MAIECPKCRTENPESQTFCGACGTRLDTAASGTGGAGGAGAGPSFTRTMETPRGEFGRGTVFAGRFEVIEELGAGGMGKVLRAFDKEVGEEVAIKVLHPEIALSRKTVDRFRNEIKLARKITHKNVCRMHELHQEGATLFITMEFVPGQDLKRLIRQTGALTTGKAIWIARQVAEGLDEAHELGVVHRDLKPQNIMVDKEGSAKVMDFGIARSLTAAGVTAEGTLIGTPDYMSPEQVEGKGADQRSDIYSLGVILFEMVTGRVPFEGDTPLSVAYKHKNELPIPPRKLNSQVPEPLNKVILRCLEKEKANRYQTAEELLSDLALVEEGLPISERVAVKTRPTVQRSALRPAGIRLFLGPGLAALGVVLVALVLKLLVFPRKTTPAAPKIANSVAVISFENLTGDKDLDIWTRGVPELLITNLENTGYFQVTTWDRMRDILKQMGKKDVNQIDSELGFELCRRAGIESLITGTLTKAGDMFALDARVLDAETKKLRKSAGSRGEGEESIIRTQADEICRAIAEGLGTAKEKIAQTQFQVTGISTDSLEAYRLYLIGMERNENLDVDRAAEYLERAVKIDPSFAMAYHELGMAYITIGKPAAAREAYAKAMELSSRASEKDRLIIGASHAQYIERDRKKATTIREEIVRRFPDDKWNHFWLGYIYYEQYRLDDAVKVFEKCLQLDPDFGQAANHLGQTYLALAEFEKAVEATKRYIAITPGEADPWDSLGVVYAEMGKIDEAIDAYKEALKIRPDSYSSTSGLSYLLAFKEEYSEALGSIERYLTLNMPAERRAQALLWKGFYLYWLGRFNQSLEALRQAQEAGQAVDHRNKGAIPLLSFRLYYDEGEYALAKQSAQSLVDYRNKARLGSAASNIANGRFLSGLCDLREGRSEAAKSELKEMKILLDDVSGREKENLAENIALLQTEIHLAEAAIEVALSYLEQNDPYLGDRIIFLLTGFSLYTVIDSNWTQFRSGLARAYETKGDLDRAIAEYERLTAPDRKKTSALIHPRYFYSLGKLYEQKGMKEKASKLYRRFLDLWKDADPGRREVEDARARLAALGR